MKECCGRTPAECRRLPRVASRVVSGPVDNGRYLSVLSHLGGRPAGVRSFRAATVATPAACCSETREGSLRWRAEPFARVTKLSEAL